MIYEGVKLMSIFVLDMDVCRWVWVFFDNLEKLDC